MTVTTFTGIVENGQIRLSENVQLPEHANVFVIVPGLSHPTRLQIVSPRLLNPNQAADFQKVVGEEDRNAEV